ncbi:MAG TPA: MGMT family protein [Solirubrobacterales bacterium]|nr:MGMT family protein [Solirubrobacterales bacterium]
MPTDSLDHSHNLAAIKFHRALERAHGDYAQSLAAALGEDIVEVPALRGPVQRRIAALPGLATIKGMTAGEIATELDYDEANTYTAVAGLEKASMVEVVEGSRPRRWRLTVKHRRNRVLRMSRLIPKGRWTTYGEFSIAIYGNWRMAITVGQVAKKNPAFANPHRVLKSGGRVDDEWRDDEGRGPEECKRRLTEEKVWLGGKDTANRKFFLGWEELKRLLEAAEADEESEQAA